jgi:polar amino acid transport system substrate-binding protein
MLKLLALFLISLSFSFSESKAEVDLSEIKVITSQYEPYSYFQNGKAQGEAVNQAYKIFAQLKFMPTIKVYPWARAYQTALNTPNTLIFSMARTAEREDLFHWVGEIVNFNVYLFKDKKRSDIEFKELAQAAPYKIGALNEDVKGKYLAGKHLNITSLTNEETGIKMVLSQRIDLLPTDIVSMKHRLKKLGLEEDALVPVYFLNEISRPLYIAFSKDTPIETVNAFRVAYKKAFP